MGQTFEEIFYLKVYYLPIFLSNFHLHEQDRYYQETYSLLPQNH